MISLKGTCRIHSISLLLLLGAAATIAILHAILPDHWVPLAVVARTQRWSMMRVTKVTILAAAGHVIASLVLAGLLALIGLQFQQDLDTQQGHIIGGILVLTGIAFLIWGLLGGGQRHHHDSTGHTHRHGFGHGHAHFHERRSYDHLHEREEHGHTHSHDHGKIQETRKPPLAGRLAALAVPFGVAASPDLTILSVALAASASGTAAVMSVLSVFTALTLATFVGLTVLATLAGYQIKGV